ncbi:hypothetical protein [Mucilaginibacter sp. 44-25]|uniref:hypothetical protein n=1 Tax=Mucilaginibacter sp. 44-25 TaxID=1895794 RepID=UPI0025E3748C|nr:hypothetical protein [Mucilaginibacter sp. 44-25]
MNGTAMIFVLSPSLPSASANGELFLSFYPSHEWGGNDICFISIIAVGFSRRRTVLSFYPSHEWDGNDISFISVIAVGFSRRTTILSFYPTHKCGGNDICFISSLPSASADGILQVEFNTLR